MTERHKRKTFSSFEVSQAFHKETLTAGIDRNKAFKWFDGETPEFVGRVIDAYYEDPSIDAIADQLKRSPQEIVKIVEIGTRQLWHASPASIRELFPMRRFKVGYTPRAS